MNIKAVSLIRQSYRLPVQRGTTGATGGARHASLAKYYMDTCHLQIETISQTSQPIYFQLIFAY